MCPQICLCVIDSTHHLSPATSHITEVVVPLLAKNGRPDHDDDDDDDDDQDQDKEDDGDEKEIHTFP